MNPETAPEALAYHLRQVPELTGGAHYPSPGGAVPEYAVLVDWLDWAIDGGDADTWLLTLRARIVAPLRSVTELDVRPLNALVVKVRDRFHPWANPAAYHLEYQGERVEHCMLTGGEFLTLGDPPQEYAADCRFAVKLRRFPT